MRKDSFRRDTSELQNFLTHFLIIILHHPNFGAGTNYFLCHTLQHLHGVTETGNGWETGIWSRRGPG